MSSDALRRVVVVAPHPDDETIGAGGAAALHERAGDVVTVVVVTDGSASRALGLAPDEMRCRRAREAGAAAAALGLAPPFLLGLTEGRWGDADAAAPLAAHVAGADLVYAPSCIDFHPEHVRVARLLASLLPPDQRVRVYQIGVPLTRALVNRVIDTGAVAAAKQRALDAYASQRGALVATTRLARYEARRRHRSAVEVFWELSGAAYSAVMTAGDWRHGRCPYRGLRPRPLTDPLAFLAGRRARLALRGIATAETAAAAPTARPEIP